MNEFPMGAKLNKTNLDTLLVHGGCADARVNGATVSAVYQSTGFEHASAESMEQVFLHKQDGYVYSRLQNPTVADLEARLAAICGARGAIATASGMSAIMIALLGLLKSGDEVLVGKYLFGGTYQLFNRTLRDLGIVPIFFDPREPGQARRALTNRTKVLFLEAIANPAMVVPNFEDYGDWCREVELPLLVDATLITPYHFDADALGADIAVFSTSKFIAGPAVAIGGLLVDTGRARWSSNSRLDFSDRKQHAGDAYLQKIRHDLMVSVGPSLSPFVAFLQLLGLETIGLRLERQCNNALAVARVLQNHPRIHSVLYPGLPDSPYHDRCKSQFNGFFGSVLTFSLAGRAECFQMLNRLRLIRRVANLGDTKTLALHPASTIYGMFWKAEQEQLGVAENMIRLSLGIEHPGDIIDDLEAALGV